MTKPTKETQLKYEEFREFYDEFVGAMQESSERGFVILGTAYLDEAVRQLLGAFLVDDEGKQGELLDGGGRAPLGAFGSRIEAAYLLGLISREEYEDLNALREIRNQYAHALHGITLDNDYLRSRVGKLQLWKQLGGVMAEALMDGVSARQKIQFTVTLLKLAIDLRIRHAVKERREPGKRLYLVVQE
jgi:DNA-binding MltR family transcriptional regulator